MGDLLAITKLSRLVALGAAALVLSATSPLAAERCLEGRTFSGACVKPDLAKTMRKAAIVYSLPKFSYTAPPVLPSEDGEYALPPDYNELKQLFCVGAPALVLTGPGVACR